MPWLVVGGGNNVLVSDRGIEGLVILNRLRGISVVIDGGSPVLHCGAGVFFARAAQFSAKAGFTGMEWGIAIPGTVGGGVVNNAGAHMSDVATSLVAADVVTVDGQRRRLSADDLAYEYRQSALKTRCTVRSDLVVTACRFRLRQDDVARTTALVEEMRRQRIRTQPIKEFSAGSTFKNPPGEHAGALIDRAGLKGLRIGDAQISPLHANFILNLGRATADDVVSLMRLAQRKVLARFGIHLEPEVQFVGRWDSDVLESVLGDAA
jgi:UDP-N-acetylmuramate dehydrogenase